MSDYTIFYGKIIKNPAGKLRDIHYILYGLIQLKGTCIQLIVRAFLVH